MPGTYTVAITSCRPQYNADVTSTRLVDGTHENQQACHIYTPPNRNIDSGVSGLGQLRWAERSNILYADFDRGTDVVCWNKKDRTWHRNERKKFNRTLASPPRPEIKCTGLPPLATKFKWPALPKPTPITCPLMSPPSRSSTRSPKSPPTRLGRCSDQSHRPAHRHHWPPRPRRRAREQHRSPETPVLHRNTTCNMTLNMTSQRRAPPAAKWGDFVEYSKNGGKGRQCNTTLVWVCTQPNLGTHDLRCAACMQLTSLN